MNKRNDNVIELFPAPDPLSQYGFGPPGKLSEPKICKKPNIIVFNADIESLSIRDFKTFNVSSLGKTKPNNHDKYSELKFRALVALSDTKDVETICSSIANPKYRCVALRWRLRGLETRRAILKALVDLVFDLR